MCKSYIGRRAGTAPWFYMKFGATPVLAYDDVAEYSSARIA